MKKRETEKSKKNRVSFFFILFMYYVCKQKRKMEKNETVF